MSHEGSKCSSPVSGQRVCRCLQAPDCKSLRTCTEPRSDATNSLVESMEQRRSWAEWTSLGTLGTLGKKKTTTEGKVNVDPPPQGESLRSHFRSCTLPCSEEAHPSTKHLPAQDTQGTPPLLRGLTHPLDNHILPSELDLVQIEL